MFGRRRRPILGAAVVVGASRAVAKREVKKQAIIDSQRDMDIEREVEAQRRQEEEQDRRTQRAVDEAMRKAATENQAQQQFYNTQPPMPIQTQDMGFSMTTPGQPYIPVTNGARSIQPEQLMRAPSPQVPTYLSGSPSQDARPRSAQGIGSTGPALGSNTRYCTQCGFACQFEDRFCRRCGAKQVFQ